MSRAYFLFFLGAILAQVGCGTPQESPGVVKGRVVNQGKPITDANIYFEKADADHSVFANLQTDGTFHLKTNVSAGLPAGSYKIAVRPDPGKMVILVGDESKKLNHPLIPERFMDAATSGLKAEVRPGENPPFEFDLGK